MYVLSNFLYLSDPSFFAGGGLDFFESVDSFLDDKINFLQTASRHLEQKTILKCFVDLSGLESIESLFTGSPGLESIASFLQ